MFEKYIDLIVNQIGLSKRERTVVKLILNGNSVKEIEDMLFVSDKTVKFHSTNCYKKIAKHFELEKVKDRKIISLIYNKTLENLVNQPELLSSAVIEHHKKLEESINNQTAEILELQKQLKKLNEKLNTPPTLPKGIL
jgi:hypothetical protein